MGEALPAGQVIAVRETARKNRKVRLTSGKRRKLCGPHVTLGERRGVSRRRPDADLQRVWITKDARPGFKTSSHYEADASSTFFAGGDGAFCRHSAMSIRLTNRA